LGCGWRALTLLAALLSLGVLAAVPLIGPLLIVGSTLIGIGALALESVTCLRRRGRAEQRSSGAGELDHAPAGAE